MQPSRAALVPPGFLDCVVALGETLSEFDPRNPTAKTAAPQKVWFTEGTGFFYGYLTAGDLDPAKRTYEVYLVTAGHVVADHVA
jgi:S1-C subfamily serine protease